jgi:tetratricopeptide (TPR) repeat protein
LSTTEPVAGTAARRARQEAERRAPRPERESHDATDEPAGPPPSRRQLDPDALVALEEERDFLLRSLRDLEREHDVGDVDGDDYETLKDDYTARAAAALRAIETRRSALAARRPPGDRRRRNVIAALVVLFAVVLGVGVAQASGRRGGNDEITGDIRQSARDKTLAARQAMGDQQYREAIGLFDEVIAMSPSNVEAHTYKGWLLVLVSRQSDPGPDQELLRSRARESLNRAVELDARSPDARIFRASLLSDTGEPAAGIADLDALQPSDIPPELQPRVTSLRTRLQEQQAAATSPPTAPG